MKHIGIIVGILLTLSLFPQSKSSADPSIEKEVVTWTRVNRSMLAFSFLVKPKMKDSLPEYQAIPGLKSKAYTLETDGKLFGGVYLWDNEAAAKNWFNPSWFQKVKDKFGETEVPILKVVWRPEIKEFQNKKQKASFATVFSLPLTSLSRNWNVIYNEAIQEPGFLSFIVARQENGTEIIFIFWENEDYGYEKPKFLSNFEGKLLGKLEIPLHISK
ncbi:MAG: YdhR family protein [Leptospiraceae bacterium]|nr:YdhR family protein [Leptospiraceae bacterium]